MSWLGNLGKSIWDVAKIPLSVVPGVGQYLGSMESADAQQDANSKNLRAVRETNAANAALWREQTEYNTPINQMARLNQAGLNPNLAYGTIAESRASSAPSMESPEVEPVSGKNYSGFDLAQYQQIKNMQTLNARNNIDLATAKANAIKAKSEADYSVYETDTLKKSGTLKGDPTIGKYLGRGTDALLMNMQKLSDWMNNDRSMHSPDYKRYLEIQKRR